MYLQCSEKESKAVLDAKMEGGVWHVESWAGSNVKFRFSMGLGVGLCGLLGERSGPFFFF